jgi:hypothetical protein
MICVLKKWIIPFNFLSNLSSSVASSRQHKLMNSLIRYFKFDCGTLTLNQLNKMKQLAKYILYHMAILVNKELKERKQREESQLLFEFQMRSLHFTSKQVNISLMIRSQHNQLIQKSSEPNDLETL